MRRTVATIVLAVLLVGCAAAAGSRGAPSAPGAAEVVRVVDGDTIVVRVSGRDEHVRLIGVDTPETVRPNTPVQCFGKEASTHTKQLLPPGTAVRLVRDVELRDKYDRLLAYVYRRSDDLFVNAALVRDGYARTLTYPPNVAHTADFVRLAGEARAAGRGLWRSCEDPVGRNTS